MFIMEHVVSMDDLGRTRILGNEGSVIDATVYHYMSTRNMTHMLHGAGIFSYIWVILFGHMLVKIPYMGHLSIRSMFVIDRFHTWLIC